jgi:hypothetical protein
MAIIIFCRIAGSAHRARLASLIFATLEGSLIAARKLAAAIGSAQRAFAACDFVIVRVLSIRTFPRLDTTSVKTIGATLRTSAARQRADDEADRF